jgi:Rrf2 family transcriptional regulator, nitric oxide-sensitive transcriptional repressor
MKLTQFSDYALRTLLYLGVNRTRPVPLGEIASAYGVSYHHLVKVAGMLGGLGLVESVRGRAGGYQLLRELETINLGWLIRRTEPDFDMVECFDRQTDQCPITPVCRLKGALVEARDGFLGVLDGYTLADFAGAAEHRQKLVQLWDRRAQVAAGAP